MTFQIVRISPTYCPSTDAMIGSRATPLPMSYSSEALARRLAARLADEDFRSCGDAAFAVVEYGRSPYSRTAVWPGSLPPGDEMPF